MPPIARRSPLHRWSLLEDRRGLSSLEYAVLFVLLCVGVLVLWSELGDSLACGLARAHNTFARTLGSAAGADDRKCAESPRGRGGPGTPASGPSSPQPPASANPGTAASTNAPSMPATRTLPATATIAPAQVTLPGHVHTSMQRSFQNSFPGGSSQERGATLVRDASGNVVVRNERSGTSDTMSPDRNVAAGDTIIGTYHTHPYDQSEGGHRGVSFSGADIAYANHFKEPVYVDAGSKQFMIVPSQNTNATSAAINNDWNGSFSSALSSGKSIQDASAEATQAVASKYDMAYYEGTNGSLVRVTP